MQTVNGTTTNGSSAETPGDAGELVSHYKVQPGDRERWAREEQAVPPRKTSPVAVRHLRDALMSGAIVVLEVQQADGRSYVKGAVTRMWPDKVEIHTPTFQTESVPLAGIWRVRVCDEHR